MLSKKQRPAGQGKNLKTMKFRFFNSINQHTGDNYTLAVDASKIEVMDMSRTYDQYGNQLGEEYEGEEVEVVEYWNGHNWATFICEDEIKDKDQIAQLLAAIENKENVSDNGYDVIYKADGFEISMPKGPSAWQFEITEI